MHLDFYINYILTFCTNPLQSKQRNCKNNHIKYFHEDAIATLFLDINLSPCKQHINILTFLVSSYELYWDKCCVNT